jgi:O-acetyl-ADP-ribose deacetylase (regulator of RNase III)
MKLTLFALDQSLREAWEQSFRNCSDVTISVGSILHTPADAIVSPANSYGFMDGGFDWLLTQRFGTGVQSRLQQVIKERYYGELLVGQAVAIPTNDDVILHVIAAPTMRVPMILGDQTINPYLAMRAILIEARSYQFKHVTMTGLGTGVGKVPPELCASQMRQAYDHIIIGNKFPITWQEAQINHQRLYMFEHLVRDLQF